MYKIDRREFIGWILVHHPTKLTPTFKQIAEDLALGSECIITAEDVLKRMKFIPIKFIKDFKGEIIEDEFLPGFVKAENCKLIFL